MVDIKDSPDRQKRGERGETGRRRLRSTEIPTPNAPHETQLSLLLELSQCDVNHRRLIGCVGSVAGARDPLPFPSRLNFPSGFFGIQLVRRTFLTPHNTPLARSRTRPSRRHQSAAEKVRGGALSGRSQESRFFQVHLSASTALSPKKKQAIRDQSRQSHQAVNPTKARSLARRA